MNVCVCVCVCVRVCVCIIQYTVQCSYMHNYVPVLLYVSINNVYICMVMFPLCACSEKRALTAEQEGSCSFLICT